MIILTFFIEKLARICHHMVAELGEKDPLKATTYRYPAASILVTSSSIVSLVAMRFESWEEFRMVVSKLLELQLCGLRRLVKQLVGKSRWMDSGTLARRLTVTDELVSLAFSLLPS